MRSLVLTAAFCALAPFGMTAAAAANETLQLFAAGSLKAALGDVAAAYETAYGATVETTFGASGLLRERIEKGETAHVFASANLRHPQTLSTAGRGGPAAVGSSITPTAACNTSRSSTASAWPRPA